MAVPCPEKADGNREQIDSVPDGAVIFVSCPAKTPNAVYGGLMSTRAKVRGAVGSVIDGRFRDLEEQRALDYPVRHAPTRTITGTTLRPLRLMNCRMGFLPRADGSSFIGPGAHRCLRGTSARRRRRSCSR